MPTQRGNRGHPPGGWRDMIGAISSPTTGPNRPTWTQINSSAFYGYAFGIGDQLWVSYHIQHDYLVGTDMYFHTHWLADGSDVNTVKWQFTHTYAMGFDQSVYDTDGSVVTVEEAPTASLRHMTSEMVSPSEDSNYETDGIILLNIKRITNGGTDNASPVILLTADIHYQADALSTPNRTPPFYPV